MAPQHLPVTSFRRTSFGLHSTEFQLQDEIQVSHTKPKFELLIKLLTRSVRGVGKLSSKANVARVECFGAAESFATISVRFQKKRKDVKKVFSHTTLWVKKSVLRNPATAKACFLCIGSVATGAHELIT